MNTEYKRGYYRGYDAYMSGQDVDDCPISNKNVESGWLDGYFEAKYQMEDFELDVEYENVTLN